MGATLAAIKQTAAAKGASMTSRKVGTPWFLEVSANVAAQPAHAQSFQVRCPTSPITRPSTLNNNNSEPAYIGQPTLALNTHGYMGPTANVNGAIKCQQVSGGDGYATMDNGTRTFLFSFGPLSGLSLGIRNFCGSRLN
jgi:hypothetical protein